MAAYLTGLLNYLDLIHVKKDLLNTPAGYPDNEPGNYLE
jgi:hypothetical protein